ncbi:hypothetical protein UFOVP901_22 [uncultured Caudovirales phage]|uniref:Uncharacterized protein n=1 Tax=uncultured Caudovirales phage TaxID=2100421 RepID=A0A6J5PFQ2_9CAUD|nr:hypothetical protein UFOVP901_22 [uncultured Caudovirales phage]
MKYFILILFLTACGKHQPKPPTVVNSAIVEKANLYKSLHKDWAHGGGCDSLGFTALCKISGGCADVNIFDAESASEPGRWYRNASQKCFDEGKSASDISKDMFAMLLPYLYATGDQTNLKEIYAYGKAKGWVMGRGPMSRTVITPPMIFMLQIMIGRVEPIASQKIKAGYEKHLDVMSFYSQTLYKNGMDLTDYETLRKYAEESPRNALMQALYHKYKDGDQSKTIAILMDETLFPSGRLPTPSDRCEEYLWQRDDLPKDWASCGTIGVHDGVDFLIAAKVAGQL